jgi:hypothetical protein
VPLARFKSEVHRQEFVRNLEARGFKSIEAHGFKRLPYMTFRVYNYMPRHCVTPELRVSYYESQTGPEKPITKPSESQKRGTDAKCKTPGHGDRKALCRDLCTSCYQRYYYWSQTDFRKRKRITSLKRKHRKAAEARGAA